MHSVLRIWGLDNAQILSLTDIDLLLYPNTTIEDCKHIRGDTGYSFTLSENDNWNDHHEDVFQALKRLCPVLNDAKKLGASFEIDTGIYEDDYNSRPITSFYWSAELLQLASKFSILFMFSIYNIIDC